MDYFYTLHYFETLYIINQKLIKFCGADAINNFEESYNIVLDICEKIPRVIPYKIEKEDKTVHMAVNDGLLVFKNDIPFIENDFQRILKENEELLFGIKMIRNKLEHKIHNINFNKSSSGSTSPFEITINVDDIAVSFNTIQLIKLIKMINEAYSKIRKLIEQLSLKDSNENDYYIKYLDQIDFLDFNTLYDDQNIKLIGKLQYGLFSR